MVFRASWAVRVATWPQFDESACAVQLVARLSLWASAWRTSVGGFNLVNRMEPTQWLLCPILCPGEYFMFCPAGPRPGHWSHGMSRARVIPPGIVRRSMNSSSDCISVIADDRPQLQSMELVLSLVSYFESNSDIVLMFQDYSWRKNNKKLLVSDNQSCLFFPPLWKHPFQSFFSGQKLCEDSGEWQ